MKLVSFRLCSAGGSSSINVYGDHVYLIIFTIEFKRTDAIFLGRFHLLNNSRGWFGIKLYDKKVIHNWTTISFLN